MKKTAIDISIVAPIKHQCPYQRQDLNGRLRGLHPAIIRDALAGGLDRAMFPLLDSRTRYWRYYLLIGPQARWGNYNGIGWKLYRIAKQNRKTERVTRGIGKNLVNRCSDLGRGPKREELVKLGKLFRQYYGSTVESFWDTAKKLNCYRKLYEVSRKLQIATAVVGFFDLDNMDYTVGEGFVRQSFHRILLNRNNEIARLLKRKGYYLWEAIASSRYNSFSGDDPRRMILAWALLRVLYGKEIIIDPSNADDESEDDEVDSDLLRRIALTALQLLKHNNLWGNLDENNIRQIEFHIKSALKNKPYVPPLPVPPLAVGQKRQRLFSDMRLTAFNNLLRQTDNGH
jgi:hypothetical protein